MLSTTYEVQENMVWNLAEERLEKVGRGVSRTTLCEKKTGWLPAFLLNHVGAWFLNHFARRFTDDAIWFRGVASEICNQSFDDRPKVQEHLEPMMQELERLKNSLREMRGQVLRYQIGTDPSHKLYRARSAILAATNDLFEATENLRWAILEMQANSAKRLSGMYAESADALDELFCKLD